MPSSDPQNKKAPKTELDRKFLFTVEQAMSKRGIQSDRAMSIELDRHPNFINRVRNGLQSAPPDAWETLRTKFPADSATTNVTGHGSGQTVGTVQGDNIFAPTSLEACQMELEQHKRDLTASRGEVEQLRQQVAAQEKLLASQQVTIDSKEEIISLLRGGFNRPN